MKDEPATAEMERKIEIVGDGQALTIENLLELNRDKFKTISILRSRLADAEELLKMANLELQPDDVDWDYAYSEYLTKYPKEKV
jgi:hypothetical protein